MSEKNPLKCAKWIWCNETPQPDEYGEFYTTFSYNEGSATLHISADSDYAVYLNGTLCAFGQYHDYPYDKIYDTVDISSYCQKGENHLAIVVWYYGDGNMSYYPGHAGLLFALIGKDGVLAQSDTHIRSRISPAYENHRRKKITAQMGLGFAYDATQEDGWKQGELHGFADSTVVEQDLPLRPRPCEKLRLEEPRSGTLTKQLEDGALLFDLGQNTVGFLQLRVTSPTAQRLTVSWGEHISDGRVRRLIGKRDFSAEITVREGETCYLNPFRRLGCRYLEISAEAPLAHCEVAVCPTTYPLRELPPPPLAPKAKEIYDICVNTLRLCMHEHYEDCPWREQALYCMDSRNQMLCGYFAFGETGFPRANLELIAADDRPDGLLSICCPSREPLAIPSFSLHYFTECAEYLHYSGDIDFLRSIYPKLQSVLQVFLRRCDNGNALIPPFPDAQHWNFYEWRPGLDGGKSIDRTVPDLPLNALLSLALQHMADISDALEVAHGYRAIADRLNEQIANNFFDNKKQLCFDRNVPEKTYSALGNALAVLCGVIRGENAITVCEKLAFDRSLTPISVSMQCFVFDALLQTDFARFRPYVLEKIEQTYRPMVELGLGTVWETEQGEADFQNAGSLCHGWSAMPVYYYHILK
ncbi:MAG: hypothetical protein E7590_03080 [Ruminococcaceae bacterium]|nr:hypothetical protein [Oscillospiraceae bacterium]